MTRVIGAGLAAMLSASLLVAPLAATAPPASADPAPTPAAAPQVSSDGVAPIAVLLDTSGSMNDDDGAGTLKLRGAKNAVRDIVRNLSPTTVFALRTYPARGGCDGGTYIRPPAPLTNAFGNNSADDVLASVEGITAGGSTPTGEALRALADDLTARGYTAATIVLVSDGESTCGTPPCDVAKQLVSRGFDVTVPTIGFRTSAAGSKELACVAEATGSVYLDASDSGELADRLDSLVRAKLELTVRYDPQPMPGGSTKITAVVRHSGGEDAKDVRVALTLADADAPQARRVAIPPMIRIGNIPAGATIERSWTVGTGPRGDPEKTLFTVSAWATNAVRVTSGGTYTPAEPTYSKDELGELFAGVDDQHPLIVFGDSFSSGEGAGDYFANIRQVPYSCHRSEKTYLGRVFAPRMLRVVACSGAESQALTEPYGATTLSQIAELNSLRYVPGAGVMTFGGNDIGFKEVVTACVLSETCGDAKFKERKITEAESLGGSLWRTYVQAWSAMNTSELRAERDNAFVPLIVLPYPKLTPVPARGGCAPWFTPEETAFADQLVAELNQSVAESVARAQRLGYSVFYASDVEDAFRPDNTVCASEQDRYANGLLTNGPAVASESFHPTASGYIAETDAIIRWSHTVEVWTKPGPLVTDDVIRAHSVASVPVDIEWPTPYDINKQLGGLTVPQGGILAPTGSGFAPGTPVTTTIHSDPTVLGTLIADDSGHVDGTLRIPADIQPGRHTLVISALSADGEFIERRIPVSVVLPTPWWVWGALVMGVVFLIGALALVAVGLSKRRRARLASGHS
ncbi:VWA domain-containing protein [Microbacterium sp.]|uniref:VWA domain-containing protein n=1 Tax=Microbacterium sp. TaxID=51671 RepID=UPI000926BACB|nr:VWA domain-containing protein [Microbacterium sp.]MBN9187861.1 VWA domain-containing protein [Microbacterium sp.]MBN9192713.1 VWA domain-containing protein [Microbacterium sp.]OJU70256.1 MAG: hypothetical protein BGO04_14215 [Microbacterium sp. 70-38]